MGLKDMNDMLSMRIRQLENEIMFLREIVRNLSEGKNFKGK